MVKLTADGLRHRLHNTGKVSPTSQNGKDSPEAWSSLQLLTQQHGSGKGQSGALHAHLSVIALELYP